MNDASVVRNALRSLGVTDPVARIDNEFLKVASLSFIDEYFVPALDVMVERNDTLKACPAVTGAVGGKSTGSKVST